MQQIICPVCKLAPSQSYPNLAIVFCTGCQIRWTFINEDLESAVQYRDEVYSVVDNRHSIFERIIFAEARNILQGARNIYPEAETLLDFGSGKGQFLALAKAEGWSGIGVETEKTRADFAVEKYQVVVLNKYYFEGKIGAGEFDLISLNHVFEHLPEPIDFMTKLLQQNLSSNGLVYVEVPRVDSWQAKIAGADWMHLDIPKHLTHWTASKLEFHFENIGYRKVGARAYSVHLGILGMLQALLSAAGFRDNIIIRLKRKKTVGLLLLISLVLPLAWILESFSVAFGRSGIIGLYLRRE
jgi:SAM-dependent methyltransferase